MTVGKVSDATFEAEVLKSTNPVVVDMATVRRRKQDMIDREIKLHLDAYKEAGAELIIGQGRFIGPKTIERVIISPPLTSN